jgi:hypothetical protein
MALYRRGFDIGIGLLMVILKDIESSIEKRTAQDMVLDLQKSCRSAFIELRSQIRR